VYETWSLTLREEHRLGMFQSRVLRKIFVIQVSGMQCSVFSNTNKRTLNHAKLFALTREEVAGGWTKVHNEKLHDMHSSTNNIRIIKLKKMKWVGHLAHIGEKRNGYRVFVGTPKRKTPLGRPRHISED
jgi:hypothetical protein